MLKALPTYNFGIQSLTKCAEIFCYNFTEFTFCCSFCQNETFTFEDFVHHVKYLHFSKEAVKSDDEDQELDIDSFPKSTSKLKDDEKNTCNTIEQSHNNYPDVEKQLEYSKDFNYKELCKFEAEDEELNCFDGFPNDKYKLEDKEINIYDSLEQPCNENADNIYDELKHTTDFSDNDICHGGKIKEINSSDKDCNNSETDALSDNEYSSHKNQKSPNEVGILMSNISPLADASLSGAFKEKQEFITQSLKNSKILQYKCPECYAPFFQKKDMLQHVLKQHNGLKCPQCDKRFKNNSRLAFHQRTHSTVKKFVCPIENCRSAFITETYLKRHIVIHNTERNFICDYENCDKTFQSRGRLHAHKYIHKQLKKFVCDVCGLGCQSRPLLEIHIRTHTGERPFPCKLCGKSFATKSTLGIHTTTHSEIRPHKCSLCDKAFTHQKLLKLHRYVHSDEREFKCNVCGNAFKHQTSLRNHMRKIHHKRQAKS